LIEFIKATTEDNRMVNPWFDPNSFGAWFGVIGGGLGGLAGLLGATAGMLAPRGLGKRFILTVWVGLIAIGVLMLLFGGYAWAVGQPWFIWYGPLLCGLILTVVMGSLFPMIAAGYRQAEHRRIDADGLRTA
jgi:hypothetical protein